MCQNYLIVGAGRSGIAAAKLLFSENKSVTVYDSNSGLDTETVKEKIGCDVPFILGEGYKNNLDDFTECVVSPGVALDTPIMLAVKEKGIEIIGEIELAFRRDKGQVLAITGTNGKTTTTALTYEIVKAANENTLLVGNIEIPYAGVVQNSVKGGFTVAEISSFQLETVTDFAPKVSAILNITPDHLDRHKTMEGYAKAKYAIAKNQKETDFCVLNYEDERLREFGGKVKCKAVFFSSQRELDSGIYLKGDSIILAEASKKETLVKTNEVNLVGVHNYENIMAAIMIAHLAGVPMDIIIDTVKKFKAVEHRIEFVAEIGGVKYYNDSKGTNTDAAIKAIDAMTSKTVLIAGGYDKKSEFDDWVSHLPGKCKRLILLGQTRQKIAAACDKIGFTDYEFVDSLETAVKKAAQIAEKGENVLLSPACASWDMFKSYQQRGQMFKQYVLEIKG